MKQLGWIAVAGMSLLAGQARAENWADTPATREEFQQYSKELWGFIEKDGLNVKIHDIYPLEDIKRATEDIEGRKTTGKLLLKP